MRWWARLLRAATRTTTMSSERTNIPDCPENITGRGEEFWYSCHNKGYIMRPDELALLRDCAFEVMVIETLEEQASNVMETGDLYSMGSQGQPVVNPIFSEISSKKRLLAAMLKQLHLPDDEIEGEDSAVRDGDRAAAGRSLASHRWKPAG